MVTRVGCHTHHMLTRQNALHNSVPEYLTYRIQAHNNLLSEQFTQPQNMTTHKSADNTLSMVEHTPQRQRSDSGNPFNKFAEAIAASQQRPQTSSAKFKSTTTNTLIFDRKNKKFETLGDFFQTMIKMQPEKSVGMRINNYHSHFWKDAIQTFRNMNASHKQLHEDALIIFRRQYVIPQSQATAKHKWHKLTFDPITKSLSDFLEDLSECAERAYGPLAQQKIDTLLYAKVPAHLKRSISKAYLETGANDQIVAQSETELELSGLETYGTLPISTMSTTTMTVNKINSTTKRWTATTHLLILQKTRNCY